MSTRREALSLLAGLPLAACLRARTDERPPLKIGLLTSQTGDMSSDESGVLEALRFTVDEINEAAQASGDPLLEPIEADGASKPEVFATRAGELIDQGAVALFGCWTSASRKAVLPVLDQRESFLVYPLQYEGLEQHPRVLYTGTTPNQQILPAVRWAMATLQRRSFFLVGSDYVFPRVANTLLRDQLLARGLAPVGEAYLPLNGSAEDFAPEAQRIARAVRDSGADAVLNTLNGRAGNLAFFRALREAGVEANTCPTFSFSIAERTFGALESAGVRARGDYAVWGYFDALRDDENAELKRRFRGWREGKGIGGDGMMNDPMISARAGLHLWTRAVLAGGQGAERDLPRLQQSLRNRTFASAGGAMHVDNDNQHTWRHARVGRVERSGGLNLVWESSLPIHPQPFPAFRSRTAWDAVSARYEAP